MTDKTGKRISVIVCVLLLLVIWYRMHRQEVACEARGGVLVGGVAKFHCVQAIP